MTYKKKLIEVALPLEAINVASAREKSIRHGHPSTLHLWWARRPLASCRAILFASLVDDPSSRPEEFPTEEAQEAERQRLFRIIEELVKWENSNNDRVLDAAKKEILRSTGGNPPPVLDPFCGGGSIPLEAQRLGLEVHASDLNPVAVLITKALIEIPPKFGGRPPVHPEQDQTLMAKEWRGAQGLAEDIRYYGQWMRDEAEKRIGHLYPKVRLPKERGGGEATVIAWLWARVVKCPNPACGAEMPLVSSFWLSKKKNKAWIKPIINQALKSVDFEVCSGEGVPPSPPKLGRGANFACLTCGQAVPDKYIKAEGVAGRMGARLLAIVAEGKRGRIYVSPTTLQESVALNARPEWRPDLEISGSTQYLGIKPYGMTHFAQLFSGRQTIALVIFSDLVAEVRERILKDAITAGLIQTGPSLSDDGAGALAYADAVATYLGMNVSKLANRSSTGCFWDTDGENIQQVFARQVIPMTWDFCEGNPFSDSSGNFMGQLAYLTNVVKTQTGRENGGFVQQLDAATAINGAEQPLICTDPPYYDNVPYADISDFFYIWLRRALKPVFPSLFSTVAVPKNAEIVAFAYRHDGKDAAEAFFLNRMSQAMRLIAKEAHPLFPITIFYAFKQAQTDSMMGTASTGWETFLSAVITAGMSITGTWPVRTELTGNLKKRLSALASSIVLVCRPRSAVAPMTTRRELMNALKAEIPAALKNLQHGNIAPVDLAQASIGPGMAVFSRYSKVVEADGSPMTVRTALALINQVLDEFLTEQEGEFDPDTRWALVWFEQNSLNDGPYGSAETLATAKNTAISGLVEAGILESKAGKVRLLRRDELPSDWDPKADKRLPVWELTQHLILALETKGESGAADILRQVGDLGEVARDLAYRLYNLCERKGWTDEALAYNSLVVAWPEIVKLAGQAIPDTTAQSELF